MLPPASTGGGCPAHAYVRVGPSGPVGSYSAQATVAKSVPVRSGHAWSRAFRTLAGPAPLRAV